MRKAFYLFLYIWVEKIKYSEYKSPFHWARLGPLQTLHWPGWYRGPVMPLGFSTTANIHWELIAHGPLYTQHLTEFSRWCWRVIALAQFYRAHGVVTLGFDLVSAWFNNSHTFNHPTYPPFHHGDNQKCLQILPNAPWGGRITPTWGLLL